MASTIDVANATVDYLISEQDGEAILGPKTVRLFFGEIGMLAKKRISARELPDAYHAIPMLFHLHPSNLG
jgi:hypothetical protein